MSDDLRQALADALAREPFSPLLIETTDERRIEIRRSDQAVLNSLAISVVEAPFSVTVVGLDQVRRVVSAPSPGEPMDKTS